MQAVLQSIGVPMLALERDASGLLRLLGANDDACRLLSLALSGAETTVPRGAPLDEVLPAGLAQDLTRAAADALASQAEALVDWAAPDRRLRLALRPVIPDEGAQRLLCTVTAAAGGEASDRTVLEEIQRLRLRLLDRIVAWGGHALGNHVQPILTFSRCAMDDIPAQTRNTYLGYILESAEQIQSLITVARIVGRAGRTVQCAKSEVSVDHLIEDAEDVCPLLLPPDVAARAEIETPGLKADGCRSDLILVLLTLILDAAESMVRKGEIVLRASRGDWADAPKRPSGATGACLRLDVESTGERQDAGAVPGRIEHRRIEPGLNEPGLIEPGLIERCGGGLAVFRPSPEGVKVSLFLPEKVPETHEGGPQAAP